MRKILISFCLCIVIFSGCTRTETTLSEEKKELAKETLLIGLIPERNIFHQIERYEPLVKYISKKIGIKIKLTVLPQYGNIVDNFVSTGMDGAFFGSFSYALAHAKLGIQVIARPVSYEGLSTYYGLIFVRKSSGITTAKDMEGKIFVFVDKATTAGYLLPLAYFKRNGIIDYKAYLKETYFAGTHEDAIYDVLNKKADIGAAKNTVYYGLSDGASDIIKKLTVLERSPDMPENALAVRKNLKKSIKNKLKEALLNMHNDPEGKNVLRVFGAQRFLETRDDDYANVYKYAKEIDLDLATYNYVND